MTAVKGRFDKNIIYLFIICLFVRGSEHLKDTLRGWFDCLILLLAMTQIETLAYPPVLCSELHEPTLSHAVGHTECQVHAYIYRSTGLLNEYTRLFVCVCVQVCVFVCVYG